LRTLRDAVLRLRLPTAVRTAAALAGAALRPSSDPWRNAWRIERLERREGATATSYFLAARDAPEDGEAELGAASDRSVAELRLHDRLDGEVRVGLHGSYRSSTPDGDLALERAALEDVAGPPVRDHRFHYLRHRTVEAWPLLERAGLTSDASLGYAEHPGFRAGTTHPFRAWDHAAGAPLDLVVIPLACMDASFDARYLDVRGRARRAALVDDVFDRVAEHGGAASLLVHNDRLCNLADDGWTRLYRRTLRRVARSGGVACTAAEAAAAYRADLPAHRRSRIDA
ncbi:MAG: hypothetical protein JWM98_1875, partial [Thermoleophilia bacterium]|nr:hypothetical protein [Thermoleophilia bacterium]